MSPSGYCHAGQIMPIRATAEITAVDGRGQQTNYHQFQVARMNDAPLQVHAHLVGSTELPTGVGEPGLPLVLAAFANAVFAALAASACASCRCRRRNWSETGLVHPTRSVVHCLPRSDLLATQRQRSGQSFADVASSQVTIFFCCNGARVGSK